GDLWHGTWEGDESDVRRIDPDSGEVLELLAMPQGTAVSGLEWDGGDRFFCGGGGSGKVRAIARPRRREKGKDGAPGGIRTPDQRLRKPLLYPAELRAPGVLRWR